MKRPPPEAAPRTHAIVGWPTWATAAIERALAAVGMSATIQNDWDFRFGTLGRGGFKAARPARRLGAVPGLAELVAAPMPGRLAEGPVVVGDTRVRRYLLLASLDPLRLYLHDEGLVLEGLGAGGPWSAVAGERASGVAANRHMAEAAADWLVPLRDGLWVEAVDAGAAPSALFALVALDFELTQEGAARLQAAHVRPAEVARSGPGAGRRAVREVLTDAAVMVASGLGFDTAVRRGRAEETAAGGFVGIGPGCLAAGPELGWARAGDRFWAAARGVSAGADRPRFAPPADALPLGDGQVVRAGGAVHPLEPMAARIWRALREGIAPDMLAAQLGADDLDDLLTAWSAAGLVGPGPAPAPGAATPPPPGHLHGRVWGEALFVGDVPARLPGRNADLAVPPLPRRLVVCKSGEGPSRLVPVDGIAALSAMLACGAWPHDDGPATPAMIEALGEAEAWVLEVGGDSAPRLASHCAGLPPPPPGEVREPAPV